MELLRGLDVLFLDALRFKPHPTHSTVDRSVGHRGEAGAAAARSSLISATICGTSARKAACRRRSGWLTTGWRSGGWKARIAYEDLPQPRRGARGLRPERALTIGNFDGVHCGHRRDSQTGGELAAARGWRPSVLTFDPHPARVVAPERTPRLITSPSAVPA